MIVLIVLLQEGRAARKLFLEIKPEVIVAWTWLVTVQLARKI